MLPYSMESMAALSDYVPLNIKIFLCRVRLCILRLSNHCYVFQTVICFFIVMLEF